MTPASQGRRVSQITQLATTAEQVFAVDPNTTLIKLRQLGEAIAQDIAARKGLI